MTTSNASPTPTGGDAPAAGAHRALKHDEAKKENLLEAVLASDNLARAWKRVKSNNGAPGIDGVTVKDWPTHAREHWPTSREQLESGRYRPQAVRRVEIPKPDGGIRLLGIPTVTDRVVQQAIAQVLTPIFDPTFSDSTFCFRPGRNAHQAIRQVQATVSAGYRIAVDLDLAKFFDTVGHDVLMGLLGRTIDDTRLLALIGRYLRAGAEPGHRQSSGLSVPGEGPGHWPGAACKAWSVSTSNRATSARRKAGPCRRCWPTSCCTSSTASWNGAASASRATPTT